MQLLVWHVLEKVASNAWNGATATIDFGECVNSLQMSSERWYFPRCNMQPRTSNAIRQTVMRVLCNIGLEFSSFSSVHTVNSKDALRQKVSFVHFNLHSWAQLSHALRNRSYFYRVYDRITSLLFQKWNIAIKQCLYCTKHMRACVTSLHLLSRKFN